MEEIDVNMMRIAEAEINGFDFPDDNLTFYYNETGNVRKYKVRTEMMPLPILRKQRLELEKSGSL
ncbi:hypothetical protein [[Clostridium] fimetarium]|uniref:Uncharacterized protein n=1 Tax=[Clostridium] fimetarium TaxID=99656 RepID=A0A1I0MA23_9FIRM|nr:hypothetical protein [[Clostridium] fimetarium]SEV85355.1 hypothetical protein SAMN05421659_101352 [[Clostridium] fimetarium]